jgi:lipoprotein NlpD
MKKKPFFSSIGRVALAIFVFGLSACASRSPAPVVVEYPPSSHNPAPHTHVVRSGDTLYSIAREYSMDHRDLIALNSIENPDQIAIGQVLRIGPLPDSPTTVVAPVSSGDVLIRPIGKGQAAVGGRPETARLKREPKVGKDLYSDQALAAAQGPTRLPPVAEPKAEPAKATQATAPSPPAKATDWIWPAKGALIGTFNKNGSKGVDIAGKAGDPVIAAGSGRVVYSGMGLRGYGKLVIIKHDATYLSAYAHNRTILVKEGQSVRQGQKIAEMGDTDADKVKLHFEVRRQGNPVDPLNFLPPR